MGRVLVLFFLLSSVAFSAAFDLSKVPDGYPEGREGVPYGAYSSVFGPIARFHDSHLELLQNKTHGLSKLSLADEVVQAEWVYYFEYLLLAVMEKISDSNLVLTSFEREALLYRCTRIYRDIRGHAERLYESMIRLVDVALPGATGKQQPEEIPGTLDVLYAPNCRSEKCLSAEQRKAIYQQKLKEFIASGGSTLEMRVLEKNWVATSRSFTQLEYVLRPNHEIWVTQGKAGHLLLAGGESALAAGQMAILKNKDGKVVFVVVSNASGNYKPDLYTAQRLAERIHQELGVPSERVVVTKGEPFSVQTVKIILKARKVDASVSAEKLREMEQQAAEILKAAEVIFTKSKEALSCSELLNGQLNLGQ